MRATIGKNAPEFNLQVTVKGGDFRDREEFFIADGWKIIGISSIDNILSQKLGVWREKKNYGKTYFGVSRTTFIVDKEGVIKYIFKNVKVEGHVEAILKKIKTVTN